MKFNFEVLPQLLHCTKNSEDALSSLLEDLSSAGGSLQMNAHSLSTTLLLRLLLRGRAIAADIILSSFLCHSHHCWLDAETQLTQIVLL